MRLEREYRIPEPMGCANVTIVKEGKGYQGTIDREKATPDLQSVEEVESILNERIRQRAQTNADHCRRRVKQFEEALATSRRATEEWESFTQLSDYQVEGDSEESSTQ